MEKTATTIPTGRWQSSEPLLEPLVTLPLFELPDAQGQVHRYPRRHRRRALVLYAAERGDCPACRAYLTALAALAPQIAAEEAELVVVVHGQPATAAPLQTVVGAAGTVLFDPDGRVFRRWGAVDPAGQPVAALFVADRFGTLYARALAGPDHALPPAAEVVDWLRFINIQCPECGVAEWPAGRA